MEQKLSSLKNIGPKSEKWLNKIDIYTKKDIAKLGPVNIYNILKVQDYPVSKLLVYALQGAIMDLHWNDLPKRVKVQLDKEIEKTKLI
jgi:DNA transformation protein